MKIIETVIDKDGNEFYLFDEVWMHIKRYHPEIKNIEVIKSILSGPDIIVKSSWDEESYLYYKKIDHLYRVVVVQTKEKRIKTTLTTNRIKKGEVIWTKK